MTNGQPGDMFRQRFVRFRDLRGQIGEQGALQKMLEQETERERKQMGPLIQGTPLAQALNKAVPFFETLGMKMSVADISNGGQDAVLEIQRFCPYAAHAAEFGVGRPCRVACDIDIQAVMNAFPGVRGRMLCSQADGDCTCVFKYERDSTV